MKHDSKYPLEYISSIASPPAWMKEKDSIYGDTKLKANNTALLVDYFIRFLKSYEAENIKINYTTIQNQPSGNVWSKNVNGMLVDPATEIAFLKLLAPACAAANLSTKFVVCDDVASNAIPRVKAVSNS